MLGYAHMSSNLSDEPNEPNQKGNCKSGKLQPDRLEDFYGLLNNHLSSFSKPKLFK